MTTEHGLMHGRVSYVSRRAREVTGYGLEEFSQHPSLWASLIHPDDLQMVFATTAQMAREATAVTREYRLKSSNGQYRWVEDRVVPLLDAGGTLVGYQGVATDITRNEDGEAVGVLGVEVDLSNYPALTR